jgi:hypothetical protein
MYVADIFEGHSRPYPSDDAVRHTCLDPRRPIERPKDRESYLADPITAAAVGSEQVAAHVMAGRDASPKLPHLVVVL